MRIGPGSPCDSLPIGRLGCMATHTARLVCPLCALQRDYGDHGLPASPLPAPVHRFHFLDWLVAFHRRQYRLNRVLAGTGRQLLQHRRGSGMAPFSPFSVSGNGALSMGEWALARSHIPLACRPGPVSIGVLPHGVRGVGRQGGCWTHPRDVAQTWSLPDPASLCVTAPFLGNAWCCLSCMFCACGGGGVL